MASIYWRSDCSSWYVSFKAADGSWKAKPLNALLPEFPRQKRLTRADKKAGETAAQQLEDDQQPVQVNAIDLETAASIYLDSVASRLSYATQQRYKSTLTAFVDWLCPDGQRFPLREVSTAQLRSWREHRLSDHSANTVINDIKALSAVFAWCWRQEWIEVNPVDRLERPRRKATHVEVPTEFTVLRMLQQLEDEGNRPFYLLAILGALAGLRIGDILWMKPEHVDMDRRLLRVYQGKSRKPRLVPMHPEVHRFLMDWPLEGDWLYPMPEFKSTADYRSDRPGKNFNRWLRDHSYTFTHKSLRHFFNDALRRLGVGDAVRLAVMGHADSSTNLIYSHPQLDEVRPALAILCRPSPPDGSPGASASPS